MSLKIMQGDQYAIVFTGTQDGKPLDLDKIELIEFIVGKLRKTYPEEVTAVDGKFYFPPDARGDSGLQIGDAVGADPGEVRRRGACCGRRSARRHPRHGRDQ